ncbi:hypothetical protein EI94DRAFT_1733336 [Lactarius quietus]|nr:hypothetical protein EI94DRAFT_1733336 [Lactarius quietus]
MCVPEAQHPMTPTNRHHIHPATHARTLPSIAQHSAAAMRIPITQPTTRPIVCSVRYSWQR